MESNTTGLFSEPGLGSMMNTASMFLKCSITVDDKRIDDDLFLIGIEGEGQSNVQIDNTLGGDILITAFGEKLTTMRIRGIAVGKTCENTTSKSSDLVAFYKKYRAGTNVKTPELVLTYGSNVFRGFLVGIQIFSPTGDVNSPSSLDMFTFNLTVFGSFT